MKESQNGKLGEKAIHCILSKEKGYVVYVIVLFFTRSGTRRVSTHQSPCLCHHLMLWRRTMASSSPWFSPPHRLDFFFLFLLTRVNMKRHHVNYMQWEIIFQRFHSKISCYGELQLIGRWLLVHFCPHQTDTQSSCILNLHEGNFKLERENTITYIIKKIIITNTCDILMETNVTLGLRMQNFNVVFSLQYLQTICTNNNVIQIMLFVSDACTIDKCKTPAVIVTAFHSDATADFKSSLVVTRSWCENNS